MSDSEAELSPAKVLERRQKKAQPKALKAPVKAALDHAEAAGDFRFFFSGSAAKCRQTGHGLGSARVTEQANQSSGGALMHPLDALLSLAFPPRVRIKQVQTCSEYIQRGAPIEELPAMSMARPDPWTIPRRTSFISLRYKSFRDSDTLRGKCNHFYG